FFFFSSRRRHTRSYGDWSSDVCSSDFYGRPVTGRIVVGPWSEALSGWFARPLRLVQSPAGQAVDRGRGHVSLISEASLRELARQDRESGGVGEGVGRPGWGGGRYGRVGG